ncbi:DUF885 domain-containing protein [Kordiimonas marina]|uniref:DUF885 domain-containing protein n=1 Tax=Kordiimonas marina TaxID=2872312 RepID=UPI001FF3FAD7|nr:DUF885 family protein [Kordiimonas marina]MCJ9429074.1 DUF885 family protein [Kordiimonas marina]
MMVIKRFLAAVVVVLMAGQAVAAASAPAGSPAERLQALFQKERATYYAENPGTGPRGEPRPVADHMQGVSPADQARREAENKAFLADLLAIPRDKLSAEDQLNYDLFRFMVQSRLTFFKYRTWRLPLQADSGFHTWPARMWTSVNFRTRADYEAYIRRLKDLPRYLQQNADNMKIGMKDGFTMPQVVLKGLMPTFTAMISKTAEESPFYGPFKKMAEGVSDADKAALRAEAKDAIMQSVNPAYTKLAAFMKDVYYPAARTSIGASELPDGKAYYDAMVKYYTTLDVTPEQVHQIGLNEVKRIRGEMEAIIKQVGFKGDFAAFLKFLRTDPRFYAKTPKELLMHASYIAKKIDGRLPMLFGKLPRQPYGIEPVPAVLAPNYTTGRYSGAPLDAPHGGYYWVNTYALNKRPLYNLPSLTLHEAVPGHHLQIALAQELKNVPEFRLDIYPHAFGEGWGLYSEKLGIELGIYETPYENFGRLSYEMWRACRLVIDTGIHAMGWSRERAIKLLADNSALSLHNVRTEVDRYIAWPGQALAYKMGELKIIELRKRAAKALGDKFDVRAFHDEVLSAGGVPLYILEDRVDHWIAAQKNSKG